MQDDSMVLTRAQAAAAAANAPQVPPGAAPTAEAPFAHAAPTGPQAVQGSPLYTAWLRLQGPNGQQPPVSSYIGDGFRPPAADTPTGQQAEVVNQPLQGASSNTGTNASEEDRFVYNPETGQVLDKQLGTYQHTWLIRDQMTGQMVVSTEPPQRMATPSSVTSASQQHPMPVNTPSPRRDLFGANNDISSSYRSPASILQSEKISDLSTLETCKIHR